MQEAITWICIDQNLRGHIAWLGHKWVKHQDWFQISVLGSLTGLLDRIRWVATNFLILGLSSQFFKLNFSPSRPENAPLVFLTCYKLTCPEASLTAKARIVFIHGWQDNLTHPSRGLSSFPSWNNRSRFHSVSSSRATLSSRGSSSL